MQSKCLNVLSHIMRSKADLMRAHVDAMAAGMLGVLRECPSTLTPRKELLSMLRQIATNSTPLREALRARMEELLDDRLLFGEAAAGNRASAVMEALRPSAYQVHREPDAACLFPLVHL
jgi:hypothetical protein